MLPLLSFYVLGLTEFNACADFHRTLRAPLKPVEVDQQKITKSLGFFGVSSHSPEGSKNRKSFYPKIFIPSEHVALICIFAGRRSWAKRKRKRKRKRKHKRKRKRKDVYNRKIREARHKQAQKQMQEKGKKVYFLAFALATSTILAVTREAR